MKRFILAFTVVLAFAAVNAQEAATVQKAENFLKFKELSYNFGKIKQNVPVTHDFVFSNVTDKAIVIESATASCGCTTPKKPEAPVFQGKFDKITAGFNAASIGPFNKVIYLKVQGLDAPVEIKITGEVLSEPDYVKYEKDKKTGKSGGK
ncbi:MAG TPA: DUF1573 domain-containing protein [Flavitalea sp.]|nr:DUF1573 domain-containing protein [Flavitalea sp.]